jgi:hypothetical protein
MSTKEFDLHWFKSLMGERNALSWTLLHDRPTDAGPGSWYFGLWTGRILDWILEDSYDPNRVSTHRYRVHVEVYTQEERQVIRLWVMHQLKQEKVWRFQADQLPVLLVAGSFHGLVSKMFTHTLVGVTVADLLGIGMPSLPVTRLTLLNASDEHRWDGKRDCEVQCADPGFGLVSWAPVVVPYDEMEALRDAIIERRDVPGDTYSSWAIRFSEDDHAFMWSPRVTAHNPPEYGRPIQMKTLDKLATFLVMYGWHNLSELSTLWQATTDASSITYMPNRMAKVRMEIHQKDDLPKEPVVLVDEFADLDPNTFEKGDDD